MSPGPAEAFQEFRVYDGDRRPPDWTSLVGPAQSAVFLKDSKTLAPLTRDGQIAKWEDCTFFRFDRLNDARQFCEAQVERFPSMCCEIFDSAGRAKPPLVTVLHPSHAHTDDLSGMWVRRRKVIAVVAVLCSVPLFVWDWYAKGALILPTLVGFTLLIFGLRMAYWNSGKPDFDREQQRQLEEHLRREEELQKRI